MKTLASAENDNTADGEVASGREIDHPGRQSENEETKPIPAQATCEGLIFCNSQLASSFSEVKCNRARAKAGQYLHKVLLGKLRSQSVPSLENDVQPDIEDAGMSDDIVYGSEENSKEDWYKTWPDCIDKEKMKVGLKEGENSSVDDNIDKICANPNTPRSLKDIHLPLAYSPITKGLHLIRSAPQPNTNGFANVESSKKIDDKASLPELPENIDNSCSSPSDSDSNDRTKRRLIPGILSRSVFSWRVRDQEIWSLFGRSESEEQRSLRSGPGTVGTTGLIQLERPAWLPAKPSVEHQAHSNQHSKILTSNRKKELKEAKLRQKLLQMQLKEEEEASQAARIWLHEIFPKWPSSREQKRTQEMWWRGIPPCVRGKIWKLAISNDLNLTHDLYVICLSRAKERLSAAGSTHSIDQSVENDDNDRVHSMELIKLDISRTFPHLCIFQKKGPYYDMLHSVLAAYVCYRPDVGYVQGMSFIAAILILNMDAPDAFVCFANLLNRPLHRAFFALDQKTMDAYYNTYSCLLKENLPNLYKHLQECNLSPDLYLLDWVYTVFAKATHLDLACRLWDVFLRDGEQFIFKAAIGVLKMFEHDLMTMDFLSGSKFLTRLPDDLSAAKLFKCISGVKMNVGKNIF